MKKRARKDHSLIQTQSHILGRFNWRNKKFLLIVSLFLGFAVFGIQSRTAHADTYYPGEWPGISAPTGINNALANACSVSGAHTYHVVWPSPYSIDPPFGATSYTVQLRGRSYICPGVSYNTATNIIYSNLRTNVAWATVGGTRSFTVGSAIKGINGNYSSLGNVDLVINLVNLAPGCSTFRVDYRVDALHDGIPDFDNGFSSPVTICYNPATPPNQPPTITSFNANCNTASVRATTNPNSHLYNARFSIGGSQTFYNNNASGSTVNFNTSSWKDFQSRTITVLVTDTTNGLTDSATLTIPPCLVFQCASPAITTTPSIVPPGSQFTATARFNVADAGTGTAAAMGSNGRTYNYYIRLQILGYSNPYNPAQQIGSGSINPGGSSATATSSSVTAPAGFGTYDMSSSIRNSPTGSNLVVCNNPGEDLSTEEQPFFVVRGGDVAASVVDAPTGCQGWGPITAPPGSVPIAAWNNGTSGLGNAGAGTNLAAFSRGQIRRFASAQGRNTFPRPTSELSFSSIVFGDLFGGVLTYSRPCPTDYAATRLATTTSPIAGTTTVPSTNNAYYASSNLVINSGGPPITIGLNSRPVFYVDGDVYINSNIQLASGAATIAQLPNFYLVVKGNIWIAPSVTQLDGVYIAQPSGAANSGRIYTCSLRFGGINLPPTAGMLSNSGVCRTNQLTVNGAFLAKELKLYRTNGSIIANNPAEIFNVTPSTWLAVPCAISGCSATGNADGYDAITSLPPVL